MASLFISYSRKNIESAQKLTEAFKGQNLDFWIDWEGIPPTVDWWKEIENGIEEADIFLFLISPDSCKSKVCKQEIEHAIKNGKRLIPLVVQDIKGDEAPPELGHLNWIFMRESDDFELAFQKLITAIQIDYAWVQAHRELQVKALDWEKSGHENSFLLFGKELEDAEHQLATNTSKNPHPTELQREYLYVSRKAVDRRRARNTGLTIAAVVALAALAVFGFVQVDRANTNAENTKQQTSFALSALALSEKDIHLDRSLLLSVAAFHTKQNPTTRSTLLTLGDTNPHLAAYLPVGKSSRTIMTFSPNHKVFVSADDATFILWDASSPKDPYKRITDVVTDGPISSVAIGLNDTFLAVGSIDGAGSLWDISDPSHPNQIETLPDASYIFDFLNNSSLLVSKDSSGQVSIWDVHEPSSPIKISTIQEAVDMLLVRDDLLIFRNMDSKVELWSMTDPAHPSQTAVLPNPIGSYDVNANGDLLVEQTGDTVIFWNIIDPAHPSQINTLANLKDVSDASLSVDRLAIASCAETITVGISIEPQVQMSGERQICDRGIISLWDISDPSHLTELSTFTGQNENILQLLFEPGGARLLSRGEDSILLWDILDTTSAFELSRVSTEDNNNITGIAFSPDDKLMAVGSNRIILWNVEDPHNPAPPITLGSSGQWVTGLAFSQDGNLLVASYNDKISGWDVHTGQAVQLPCQLPEGTVITSITLGRYNNSDLLAIADVQRRISFCNLSNSADPNLPTSLAGHQDWISSLAFVGGDGTRLVSGGQDGAIILWDLRTGKALSPLLRPAGGSPVTGVAFEPSSQILSARTQDNTVFLWDIHNPATPKLLSAYIGGQDFINQDRERLAMNGNHMIASGGLSDNTMLWDASNPLAPFPLATLAGNNGGSDIEEVAFIHNGNILATGSTNGTVILWDVDPSSWMEMTCQRAGRNFTNLEWKSYFPNEPYRKTCDQWPLVSEVTAGTSSMP